MLHVYDTRQESPAQQFDYWREELCSNFVELAADRSGPGVFGGRISNFPLSRLGVLRVTADAHCVSRTKRGISRSSEDCFFVNLQLSGVAKTDQGDQRVTTQAGDLVLIDARRPFSVLHDDAFDLICFKLPYAMLSAELKANALTRPLPVAKASRGYSRILKSYAQTLLEGEDAEFDGCSPVLSDQLVSLIAAAVNFETEDALLGPSQLGRFHDIRSFIDANLTEPCLSLSTVVDHFGLSPRYVQKLFAAGGSTFSQTLNQRRLEKIAARLRRPDLRTESVTEMALRCGFSDVSFFHRSFKKRFGCTPRQYRVLHLAG